MPNLLMGAAIACEAIQEDSNAKTHNEILEKCVEDINRCLDTGKVRELFELSEEVRTKPGKAETLVMVSLMLYP
jgi:hypothetical protein